MAEQIENRFRYAGEPWDSVTQQYYLRARFYNPTIARFTQEDTYRGDGLNLYAYVGNNPLTYVDPSGYMSEQKSNVYGGNKNSPYGTEGKNPPLFDRPMAGDNIGVNLRGEGMGKVQTLSPNDIRFSQNKVNDAAEIIESMKANGWADSPIEVVRMSDGKLTTIDNTRVYRQNMLALMLRLLFIMRIHHYQMITFNVLPRRKVYLQHGKMLLN